MCSVMLFTLTVIFFNITSKKTCPMDVFSAHLLWAVVTKVSTLKTCCRLLKLNKHVIKSKCFLEVPFLTFLALQIKRKRCGQRGLMLCYSQSQVVCPLRSFRLVAPFLLLAKVPF